MRAEVMTNMQVMLSHAWSGTNQAQVFDIQPTSRDRGRNHQRHNPILEISNGCIAIGLVLPPVQREARVARSEKALKELITGILSAIVNHALLRFTYISDARMSDYIHTHLLVNKDNDGTFLIPDTQELEEPVHLSFLGAHFDQLLDIGIHG